MISRQVRVQLIVFALLGLLFMGLAGYQYVGFDKVINRPYKVTAYFAQSGGIFTNAEVTYRGVEVGKVSALKLTSNGVAAEMMIDKGKQIPADTDAVVANLSFVGEQYIDLQPVTSGGAMLKAGDTIPLQHTRTPLSDTDFLVGLDKLVNSVPRKDLQILVDELGKATTGLGPVLSTLIDRSNHLTATLSADLPNTLELIKNSKQVLATANATSGEMKDSARRLASLVQQLRDSNTDITSTFVNGAYSASQLNSLLNENKGQLPSLLNNLITLGQIQDLRLPAIKQLLLIYPEDVRNSFYNAPGDGTSHFGLNLSDQAAPVCTKGYEGTTKRSGETTPSNVPANTKAFCNLPVNSATDVRGSRNAPRPPGDTTDPALQTGGAAAGAVNDTTTGVNNGAAISASYDPATQVVGTPGGKSYILEPVNANAYAYPGEAWQDLYLGPLTGY